MIAALLLVFATASWSVAIGLAPPGSTGPGTVLIALSLWTATVTSTAGMLVARSRWAQRLGLVVTGAHALMAMLRPVDGWWVVALGLSAATAVALAGPWLEGEMRMRPSAAGPPARSVLVPLLLVGAPFSLGLAGGGDLPATIVGVGALATAFVFIRALPGALWGVRIIWPALALGLAYSMGPWPATLLAAGAGVSVAVLAWHPSVARSIRPLIRRGSVVPIPPELTPKDVLDATGIDDMGRRR